MKNKLLVAVLASLPLAVCAGVLSAKAVSNTVDVSDGRTITIVMDGGTLIVEPSTSSLMTYEVDFKGDNGWLVDIFGGTKRSEEELKKAHAVYSAEKGLIIHGGKDVRVIARVTLPVKQALEVRLGAGKAEIGAFSGSVNVEVGKGALVFDGSALAEGVCVEATVKRGGAYNDRDKDCKSVGVKLHTGFGKVEVK